jgi:hypothetical protein
MTTIEQESEREPMPQLATERLRAAALGILRKRHGGVWLAVPNEPVPHVAPPAPTN